MPATRRSLLTGGIALLAGCLGTDRPARNTSPERTPATPTAPTPTPTPSGPPTVSFVGYAVQRSAFYRRHPDFEVVWAPPDRQLAFVMVAVENGGPVDLPFEDVSLRIDGRAVGDADGVEGRTGETYYPYPDECDCDGRYETYATFPLSAPTSAGAASVRWELDGETRTWELPDGAPAALSTPTTRWELVAFDAPDTVGPNESFPVSFEVQNSGDAPGTFRGVLNQTGPMHGVSGQWKTPVAAGKTVREERTVGVLSEIDSDVDEVNLRLRTVGGDVDHTVRVE